MKKFSMLFLAFTSAVIIGSEEEDQRFLEKNGTIYKINSSSLHLTPTNEDQKVSKSLDEMESPSTLVKESNLDEKDESKCDCDMTVSMGTLSPIGDAADNFDPGTSLSFNFPTKYNFNLFEKDFNVSVEVNLSNLSGINGDDNNIKAGIAHFQTDLNLPINLTFGIGLAHLELQGVSGTGVVDFEYLLPILNNDLSLGLRYQKFVDVSKEDPYLDFSLLDTYSIKLNYSKVFKF